MRLLAFTLLAIAAAMGIQCGLGALPFEVQHAMDKFMSVLIFILPMIATAGLAYAMRVRNGYAVFLAIVSPFVSFALLAFVSVAFLHDHLL